MTVCCLNEPACHIGKVRGGSHLKPCRVFLSQFWRPEGYDEYTIWDQNQGVRKLAPSKSPRHVCSFPLMASTGLQMFWLMAPACLPSQGSIIFFLRLCLHYHMSTSMTFSESLLPRDPVCLLRHRAHLPALSLLCCVPSALQVTTCLGLGDLCEYVLSGDCCLVCGRRVVCTVTIM